MVRAREAWQRRSDVLDAAASRLAAFFEDARARKLPREAMLAGRAGLYRAILDEVRAADPAFAAQLAEGGLDNASFLAVHRYATKGARIDAFLASRPTIAEALADLEEAARRGRDLWEFLASRGAPSHGPPRESACQGPPANAPVGHAARPVAPFPGRA